MIAALYVERGGPYFGRDDVEPWDKERDATKYNGPHAVVAHPPCGPWGELRHLYKGDEHDIAPLAVEQVRTWGGVLEHPRRSKLWAHLGIVSPGQIFLDKHDGVTVDVNQVDWGHVARKATRLYLVRVPRSILAFPSHRKPTHWCSGTRNPNHRGGTIPPGIKVCSAQQRRRTPPAFADWLIHLASHAETPSRRKAG